MSELKKVILDNGLTVYLLCDNTKHTAIANLIVKFGGIDDKVKLNNKIYKLKSGVAHFLEHIVLESTEYGDLMEYFGSNGVSSNGLTMIERTEFYIDTVDNLEENLSMLIKGIHSPIFDDNIINDIRKPILEEKRKSLDNKFSSLYNANISTCLSNKNFKSILGDMSDIKSISKSDLELAFKAFYRPSEEILIISGNFDTDNILNVVKTSYNELNFDDMNFERVKYPLKDKVNKKDVVVKDNTNIGRTVISFKININNLKNYEKVLFDTYIHSFLKMNFGVMSNLNIELVKTKVIIGNISFGANAIDNYYVVKIEANTNNKKDFVKKIINYIKNKSFVFDEELFNLYKKGYIIDLIVRNDNIYNMLEPLIENIMSFGYEDIDKVSDIENMNFLYLKELISNINFDNYSITELRPL